MIRMKPSPTGDAHSLPRTQQTPKQYQLAHVVRVVVGDEQCLAQGCLALAVWDGLEEIGFRIGDQRTHLFEVAAKSAYALVPGLVVGGSRSCGPVVVGPGK